MEKIEKNKFNTKKQIFDTTNSLLEIAYTHYKKKMSDFTWEKGVILHGKIREDHI